MAQTEIRYGLASTTWGPEELRAIDEVVKGGSFTMGRHVREFEEAFAARFGRKYAVMVNSGSSANLVAVAALCYRKQGALQARRRGHRAEHLVGHDLPPAAPVRAEDEVRGRGAGDPEHGRGGPRARHHGQDAHGGHRERPRQPLPSGRDPAHLRRARDHPLRGQLRVDGRHARRPVHGELRPGRHLQHLLLAPHLDDGGRPGGHGRQGAVQPAEGHPQPRLDPRPGCRQPALRAPRGRFLRVLPVHPAGLQRPPRRNARGHRQGATREARRLPGPSAGGTPPISSRCSRTTRGS